MEHHHPTWLYTLFGTVAVIGTLCSAVRIVPPPAPVTAPVTVTTHKITIMNPLDVEVKANYTTAQNPYIPIAIKPKSSVTIEVPKDQMIRYSIADGSQTFVITPGSIVNGIFTIPIPETSRKTVQVSQTVLQPPAQSVPALAPGTSNLPLPPPPTEPIQAMSQERVTTMRVPIEEGRSTRMQVITEEGRITTMQAPTEERRMLTMQAPKERPLP